MSLCNVIRRNITKSLTGVSSLGCAAARCSSLWEPDYLQLAKTKTPEYDLVNIQLKGYDYVTLENYQKLVAHLAKTMAVEVEDSWALPAKHLQIQRFKPRSTIVDAEFKLKVYERNVQVFDVKSHVLPLLVDAVATACPVGVTLSVHHHTEELEEDKFVPDLELVQLKEQLDSMGGPRRTK